MEIQFCFCLKRWGGGDINGGYSRSRATSSSSPGVEHLGRDIGKGRREGGERRRGRSVEEWEEGVWRRGRRECGGGRRECGVGRREEEGGSVQIDIFYR